MSLRYNIHKNTLVSGRTTPNLAAARYKAWDCGHSLSGLRVRIPPRAWKSTSCEFCVLEVSVTGQSLVHRSPTLCGVCMISKLQQGGCLGPLGMTLMTHHVLIKICDGIQVYCMPDLLE